jgi:hypothetical protein
LQPGKNNNGLGLLTKLFFGRLIPERNQSKVVGMDISMRQPQSFLVIVVLLFASLACSSESLQTTTLPASGGNAVLFQDDFSDPATGWVTVNDPNQILAYEIGGFRIWVNQPNFDYWSVPGLRFMDVQIEVDITKVGGPDDNDIGVICRYKNPDNFYGFLISSDGYYGISERQNGEHQVIGMDGMKHSSAIHTGNATNHVRADCVGNTLTLYVNGVKLVTVEDSSLEVGDVGLLAGSFDQPGVDILFKNFVVKKP